MASKKCECLKLTAERLLVVARHHHPKYVQCVWALKDLDPSHRSFKRSQVCATRQGMYITDRQGRDWLKVIDMAELNHGVSKTDGLCMLDLWKVWGEISAWNWTLPSPFLLDLHFRKHDVEPDTIELCQEISARNANNDTLCFSWDGHSLTRFASVQSHNQFN